MTAPIPIASGMRLTPARLNLPAWTPYTPTWTAQTTNPVLSNGTLIGRHRYLDAETVQVRIVLRPGSTTTYGSGQYRFALPVPAVAGGPDPLLQATCLMGGALYRLVGWANAATAAQSFVSMYRDNATTEQLSAWNNTAPIAFANGHSFGMSGIYYVA
ncbi:hypothetical protein GA0074692_6785 [Micromonospora pallida]|uniref:Uncharacterized protein n=1 Tax=Micromonospora pallida TaxID=145854 RepID=A0A1C6TNA6_9ACTN|nr:hypothetical protein [Micromonospora pallida]SCL43148.1 hypothetical protein GA0074692_6734 [Micromonospora pallida]SCL43246.1 hypothetical protein GA0074692_6785 [Micromonospora pallida]